MGALLASLGGFFANLIARLAPFLSKKAAVAAFLVTYTALVVAFIALLNGLLAKLVTAAPAGTLFRAGLELLPSNTGTCIAIMGSAYAARWLFIWKLSVIRKLVEA